MIPNPGKCSYKPKKGGKLSFTLRDYQVDPVNSCIEEIKAKSSVFLEAPCGSGKTTMAIAISQLMGFQSIVIMVDQHKLAEQWEERISEFLPEASVEQFHGKASKVDSIFQSQARFKVVVAQSLMNKEWGDKQFLCDLLIVDEAHCFSAPRFCKSMYNIDYRCSLGLSATPDRKDKLEWIFHTFLGEEIVKVDATTMKAKVLSPVMNSNLDISRYMAAWCNNIRGMTWKSKCEQCEFFSEYPKYCGGRLPLDHVTREPLWGDKLMWTPMLKGLVDNKGYLDQFVYVTAKFAEAGRNILLFNQFVDPLEYMYSELLEMLGEDLVGIYTSKRSKKSTESLNKRVTLVTYKIAEKGLDIPIKDMAILSSPVSDIRQTVGRVTRVLEGKPQPLIFDPKIKGVGPFVGQARKRFNQYHELGFDL